MAINSKTYWNGDGKHQEAATKLQALIPFEGEVLQKRANPKLEKYRKATNCYYDYYNNGLWNRPNEFRMVFGFSGRKHNLTPARFEEKLEAAMDAIILEAAAEQNITIADTSYVELAARS